MLRWGCRSHQDSGGTGALSLPFGGSLPAGDTRGSFPSKTRLLGRAKLEEWAPGSAGTPAPSWRGPAWGAVLQLQGGRGHLRAGLHGGPVEGALAPVPGQQLLVQQPGEGRPLPAGALVLLQEHEVVVGLAHARVFLRVPSAEEQLGTPP